jgi:hypothetical protein
MYVGGPTPTHPFLKRVMRDRLIYRAKIFDLACQNLKIKLVGPTDSFLFITLNIICNLKRILKSLMNQSESGIYNYKRPKV